MHPLLPSPALLLLLISSAAATVPKLDFNRDIQPILQENCTQCHGPDEGHRKGKLRLDVREDAMKEQDGETAIVPGQPEKSAVVARVISDDPEEIMPPPKAKKTLTAEQKEMLKRWIAEGAEYKGHWAFDPIKPPPVPAVAQSAWPRNDLDHFVLARLEKEKIAPSPEADRRTLCRRLSLDLIGLPPTPAEVEAFVQDTAPDAYERLVERLLASPHFGERWGRHWLDLARYADSDGYEKDLVRPSAYRFRDWVIDAFNRDLPFDQFTVEQLAGDLLPHPTEAQKIATGFHRQTLTNREGGVDKEEFRCKATVDRTSTTGTVWLGLTLGCAECHSHKFDPITQREFYQFYSFFNNASERDVPAPTPEEKATFAAAEAKWQAGLAVQDKPLREYLEHVTAGKLAAWEGSLALPPEHWELLRPEKLAAINEGAEEQFTPQEDGSIMPRKRDGVRTRYRFTVSAPEGTTGIRLQALADPGKAVGTGKDGDFGLSEFYATVDLPGGETQRLEFKRAAVDFADKGSGAEKLIDHDKTTSWTVKGKTNETHVAVFELAQPLALPASAKLEFHAEFMTVGLMSHFRLAATSATGALTPDPMPDEVRAALDAPLVFRTAAQWETLRREYAERIDPEGRKLNQSLAAYRAKQPKLDSPAVMEMVADTRPTHVHIRGDFLQKGDEVEAGTPAFLPPMHPRGEKADRLDLAHWLMAPENPLTARVAVNNVWRHLFGRGLVGTENDFGTRGDQPSHPELLDWLATRFRTEGWSQKGLIRLIVSSTAYRQSSRLRADLAERDPLNMLLARQGRFRLEAEVVRDVDLAVSGLLNPKIGGPSIKPALPPDLAALSYAGGLKWTESTGDEKYRRGLYIHFQRTVPLPMLITFDAPEASVSCTRRERSNSPLQALTLLNNALSVECAQALGRKLQAGSQPAWREEIRAGFATVLGRPPEPAEEARLERFCTTQEQAFTRDPAAAQALLCGKSEGDPARPATLVAMSRVLLNLDESITRE
jgi:hypothetical protein